MPYTAEISRTNPALFVFLLDQSGSMKGRFGGQSAAQASKAAGLADAINRMLSNLVIRCSQGETTRHYFDIAVLGYGAEKGRVRPALGGALAEREVLAISDIADCPARLEDRVMKQPDGAGGVVDVPVKFPIWLEPLAAQDTPMAGALREARRLAGAWVQAHPESFPPIVINLTDGESTDGDPGQPAAELTGLSTADGNVLLFNCHLSSTPSAPVLFPDSPAAVPDAYGRQMFELSSRLTPTMVEFARRQGFELTDAARGFVFQADLVDVIRFLDIGTRPMELK